MNQQQDGAVLLLCFIPGFLCGFPMLLILVTALMPNYFKRVKSIVSTRPWQSFFLGLVNFVFFFTIAAIFAESPFVPLKAMAILSLFIVLPLMTVVGLATAASITGERVLALLTERPGTPLGRLIVGIVALGISALLPIIGWVVLLILLMTGFGAALLVLFRRNGVIPVDSQAESPVAPATPEIPAEPETLKPDI
jgi:hypothetical protein